MKNSSLASLVALVFGCFLYSSGQQIQPLQDPKLPSLAVYRFGSSDLTHASPVSTIKMSPNGKVLVSAGAFGDNRICTWDANTGRLLASVEAESVSSLSFSPRGDCIAAVVKSSELRILRINGLKKIKAIVADEFSLITEVEFSPDGKAVVLVQDGKLKFLDSVTLDFLRNIAVENDRVNSVRFSVDGKIIAATTEESREIHLWSASNFKPQKKIGPFAAAIAEFAFSQDGKKIIVSSIKGDLEIWDTADGRRVASHRIIFKGIADSSLKLPVAFISNSLIATGDAGGTIRFFDLSLNQLDQIHGHLGYVNSLSASPSGGFLFSAGVDHFIRCWDVKKKKEKVIAKRLEGMPGPVFSNVRTGKLGAATGDAVTIWDLITGKQTGPEGRFGRPVLSVAMSRDGCYLGASTTEEDSMTSNVALKVWNLEKSDLAFSYSPRPENLGSIPCLRFFRDKSIFFCQSGETSALKGWDIASKKKVSEFETVPLMQFDVSYDGNWIAGIGFGRIIYLWEKGTGKQVQEIVGHTETISSVFFHPTKNILFTTSLDNMIKTWDVKDGKMAEVDCIDQLQPIMSCCISPNGNLLAAGCQSGEIFVWDVLAKNQLRRLTGHSGSVVGIQFVDDHRIFSSSLDNTCILWSWPPKNVRPGAK